MIPVLGILIQWIRCGSALHIFRNTLWMVLLYSCVWLYGICSWQMILGQLLASKFTWLTFYDFICLLGSPYFPQPLPVTPENLFSILVNSAIHVNYLKIYPGVPLWHSG